jgi:hypothetical protein
MAITLHDLCRLRNLPTDHLTTTPQLRRIVSDSQLSPPRNRTKISFQDFPASKTIFSLNITQDLPKEETLDHLKANLRFIQQRVNAAPQTSTQPPTIVLTTVPVPTTIPPPVLHAMTTITPLPSFYGDYEKDEEPTDWFRQYRLSLPSTFSDQDKIDHFELQCAAGSMAEVWVQNLPSACKATWATFTQAFIARWPPPVHVTLTLAQQKDHIKAITLQEEDIGRMIEKDRGREWEHVKWAKEIEQTAQGFGDSRCLLLDVILEGTPAVLRDLLTEQYASWPDFVTDVSRLSSSQLQRAKQRLKTERKLREDVDHLQAQASGQKKTPTPTSQPATPATTMPWSQYRPPPRYPMILFQQQQQQQPQQLPPSVPLVPPPMPPQPQTPQQQGQYNPFSTTTPMARSNLFYGGRGFPQTPSRGRGVFLGDRTRIAAQYSSLPQHPDTEAGPKHTHNKFRTGTASMEPPLCQTLTGPIH